MSNSIIRVGVTAAILAGTWVATYFSAQRAPEDLVLPLSSIPKQIGDWQGLDSERLGEREEQVLRATEYLTRSYYNDDKALGLWVAFYAMQRAGETMHSPKNCLPGAGWEIWNYGTATVEVDDQPLTINKYYIQHDSERMLVFYWYQTRDRVVASEYYAKVCLVWDALMKGRTAGSMVRLTMPDRPWAEQEGLEFAAKVIPLVRETLPGETD